MLWEIPALAIMMELRSRAVLERYGAVRAAGLYARAMTRLWERSSGCADWPPCASPISAPGGGTACGRTGACRPWSRAWAIKRFIGTSNCLIAMRRDIEAIGTNAHELPMVYSALAG